MSNYPYREWGGSVKRYTQEEIDTVEKLLQTTKNRVMYRKFLVVYLHMKEYTNLQIADMIGLNKNTVGIYINTYETQGAAGLVPEKQSGRPRKLTEEQEQKLYETISQKTPNDIGFSGMMNWTSNLACLWVLREYGVQYHVNGMLEMFHRLNLSYTRPTYVLAKADQKKQEKFKEDFDAVKKTTKRGY